MDMPVPAPRQEHRWLQQFVGEWSVESAGMMGPDQPPDTGTGTESVRALGDLWILAEGRTAGPDGDIGTTLLTLGYDPQRQRFVGAFIGSMMTHLWLYDGALDAAARILTLDSAGPKMAAPGKIAHYRDIIEVIDADHRTLTSRMRGDDGQWHRFMTAHYFRKT